ncbi:MAG: hypothetical protein QG646_1996 [Euryarchaeota archaeon]|nr:hypothetical protein [Euryarchaeota archaeon]
MGYTYQYYNGNSYKVNVGICKKTQYEISCSIVEKHHSAKIRYNNIMPDGKEQGRTILIRENCLVTPGKMKSQEIIGDHAYTEAERQQLIVAKDRL